MNGYIYKLSGNNQDSECYIGSTTDGLPQRMRMHKYLSKTQSDRKVYQYINSIGGWDNVKVQVLEYIENVQDRKALRARERHWVNEEGATLNTNVPNRTPKQWYIDNRQKQCENMRKYYQDNKDMMKQKMKIWIDNNRQKWNAYYREYYRKRRANAQAQQHTDT